jgi:hypothetical protein
MTQRTCPFQTIALDLITDLPPSQGNDSILMIVNHDCSKAAMFLPCTKEVTAEGLAQIYAQHVFPHYGVPQRIISNQDTWLTAHFTCALCELVGTTQNMSTTYHPQTDEQSKHANQCVEQYLCSYGNAQQDDWASLLPMAQFVHNSWPNETIGQTPFELLMGHMPALHVFPKDTAFPAINQRQDCLKQLHKRAQDALTKAQQLVVQRSECKKEQRSYMPYKKGDWVWLEGTNLCITHPMSKLTAWCYGPFTVEKVISPVVFKLWLPQHWKIFNVFHTSLLTPYRETEEHGWDFEESPPELIEEELEYEVKQVLASRCYGHHQ